MAIISNGGHAGQAADQARLLDWEGRLVRLARSPDQLQFGPGTVEWIWELQRDAPNALDLL